MLAGEFDVIVSNPPYIATTDIADLDMDVRGFDPQGRSMAAPDGLDCYRAIATGAGAHLASTGPDRRRDRTRPEGRGHRDFRRVPVSLATRPAKIWAATTAF